MAGAEAESVKRNVARGDTAGNATCVAAPVPPCPVMPPARFPRGDGIRSAFASVLSAPLYSAQKLGAQYACDRPLPNGNRRRVTIASWPNAANGPSETAVTPAATPAYAASRVATARNAFLFFFFGHFRPSREERSQARRVVRDKVRGERGRGVREDVLEVHEDGEEKRGQQRRVFVGGGDGAQLEAERDAVVLEVHVVHQQQPGVEQHEQSRQRDRIRSIVRVVVVLSLFSGPTVRAFRDRPATRRAERAERQRRVRGDDRAPLEHHARERGVGLALDRQHAGVREPREEREEPLEVREERGVIQRPLARRVDVPLAHGKRARDREPVPVHLEVRGAVARHERELDGGDQRERAERRRGDHRGDAAGRRGRGGGVAEGFGANEKHGWNIGPRSKTHREKFGFEIDRTSPKNSISRSVGHFCAFFGDRLPIRKFSFNIDILCGRHSSEIQRATCRPPPRAAPHSLTRSVGRRGDARSQSERHVERFSERRRGRRRDGDRPRPHERDASLG